MATMAAGAFRSDVPARMDRLPWGRWHWMVVAALGITWLIDGLEVSLVYAIGPVLKRRETLGFDEQRIGLLTTSYLVGAVLGALVFGYLTDRLGRKKLFTVTLGLYLVSAFLTAISWDFWSFAFFRFLTGAAIGGEYSAINSAVDELIPARVRGWADLAINGTFWIGSALGSIATIWLLDPRHFPIDRGWRYGFAVGAVLGLVIIFLRHSVPESPRWLLTHGQPEEADRVVSEIEASFRAHDGGRPLPPAEGSIIVHPRGPVGFGEIASVMLKKYPTRTALGLALIISQAFLYNGVYSTFSLILSNFYGVPIERVGLYLLPFAMTNFLGPALLGRSFDTVGRKPMIIGTYVVSAVLMALSGFLFWRHAIGAGAQTALWSAAFFFASAAASSAYLTVSEIFPIELRGMVIALFYAIGTAIGGPLASWGFGYLVETGSRLNLLYGNLFASALLLATVVVVALYGVKAEGASLEEVAEPLSSMGASA